MSTNDFYVGYEPRAPWATGRFIRWVVTGLILAGLSLAALLAFAQQPFDPGTFEFGVVRDFEGLLLEAPVPMLVADGSRVLLVAPGKFGAHRLVAGLDGRQVAVRGTLIQRHEDTMIELVPNSIREIAIGARPEPDAELDLGQHTLDGEIVDSKCYLGVMKPGRKKTHRACAARCISGGIPPILRVETKGGDPLHLLLVGSDGESINREILEFVAEPVSVTGRVRRLDRQLVLYADVGAIRRLTGEVQR